MSTGAVNGRPVRFFAIVLGGWTLIRLATVGGTMLAEPARSPVGKTPLAEASSAARPAPQGTAQLAHAADAPTATFSRQLIEHGPRAVATGEVVASRIAVAEHVALPPELNQQPGGEPGSFPKAVPSINPAPSVPLASPSPGRADRWRGSAWLLWREGSASRADAVAGGRLGGSQAGVRVDFDFDPDAQSRTAAYARASAALNRPASPEAAVGLAYQPSRAVPVSIAAERRIALGEGGRNANALMMVGGFGPTRVAHAIEAEAYAQTGMVGFHSRDLFIDGKLSLLSPIKATPIRLGVSVSGGAQPEVERLDFGPELQVRLPLAPAAARLSIEWRERVAGRAAPASGLAVTLASDF
ncbi:hypothetical protein [Sphingobium bisphenolivorans]|uniref:hypothetical protein n=1 Tax=Sphingobium bisphenolivorans TaxID=1335760 RepID=UPI0003A9BF8C|nr:hypothetical protein [Sphingobium bisphenolivorans]